MTATLSRLMPLAGESPRSDAAGAPLTLEHAPSTGAPTPIGIVVTGDNHLSAYLPRLSPQRRAERRARLRAGFAAAARYAITHRARLFAQVGDLFDTPTPSNEDRTFVARILSELRASGIVCVGISGNHDTPRMLTEQGGASPQSIYAAFDGLRYFARDDALVPEIVTLGGLRVAIAGLTNNPVAPPGSDPLAGIAIVDETNALDQADVGLLMLHAGIEGLCRENEGERIVRQATLAGLPGIFRVVVAGHIHRFGKQRIGERGVVVCGATERMEFGTASGSSGFAWLEMDQSGIRRAEHIKIEEQPRADVLISTSRIWPDDSLQAGHVVPDTLEGPPGADVAPIADVPSPRPAADAAHGLWRQRTGEAAASDPLTAIRGALTEVCTPETIVRLRLAGPLTLEQYHNLPLREVLHFGQQHAFSFDLDTRDLMLLEPRSPARRAGAAAGPISPLHELETLLAERLESETGDSATAMDTRAAAGLLAERLHEARDREASR